MTGTLDDKLDPKAKGHKTKPSDFDRSRDGLYGGLPKAVNRRRRAGRQASTSLPLIYGVAGVLLCPHSGMHEGIGLTA